MALLRGPAPREEAQKQTHFTTEAAAEKRKGNPFHHGGHGGHGGRKEEAL